LQERPFQNFAQLAPLIISPLFVGAVLWAFLVFVDLSPKITPDFFFSSDSKIYQQNQKIQEKFPFAQQVILNIAAPDITADRYIEKIDGLTKDLFKIEGVDSINSMTRGPEDVEAALTNPLWKRFIIGDKQQSSSILLFIKTDNYERLIAQAEEISSWYQAPDFDISMSGLPYIVEQIRRNLTQDMKTFTVSAVVLCGLVLLAVFRSPLIVLGALITCATASMLSLLIQSWFGIPIGLLTANLATIVFVLTQSHLIFMVSNWLSEYRRTENEQVSKAMQITFPASFWAMLTTLLGFVSLIFVEAKPLNQLGIGGSIGTLCALFCAYLVFPAFLRIAKVRPSQFTYDLAGKFPVSRRTARIVCQVTLVIAVTVGLIGTARLNTDPSLLEYFEKDSELYKGIYYVDKNGGSNPLLLVISRKDGEDLDTNESYDMMWDLQKALAEHEEVGSIISLPVILAEGDEHWLGQLLPWDVLIDILSSERFNNIGRSFVSKDRKEALFFLRMKENNREQDRLSIIEDIKEIPGRHEFTLNNLGGTYYLQGELAASVASSMVYGIITLLILFEVITFILSSSVIATSSIVAVMIMVTALVIGSLGLLGIPVDIISSPAINICLGLAVDEMIHLTVAARRKARKDEISMRDWQVWKGALGEQSWPAIVSAITVMIGFSVFAFSDFPPSRRFGLEIVYGAFLAVMMALIVVPYLASRKTEKKEQ